MKPQSIVSIDAYDIQVGVGVRVRVQVGIGIRVSLWVGVSDRPSRRVTTLQMKAHTHTHTHTHTVFASGRDGRCVICRRRLCVAVARGIATPAIVFVAEK